MRHETLVAFVFWCGRNGARIRWPGRLLDFLGLLGMAQS